MLCSVQRSPFKSSAVAPDRSCAATHLSWIQPILAYQCYHSEQRGRNSGCCYKY